MKHGRTAKRAVYGLCALLLICGVARYTRPLPAIAATNELAAQQSTLPATPSLDWPVQGEQAIAIKGQTLQATHGSQIAMPTASTAKLMTVLGILHAHPLAANQQGQTLTLSNADVAIYRQDKAQNDSVVAVQNGEQITEYQALQAILLPSACNMADSAAIWAFGSMPQYLKYANQEAAALGMTHTHFAVDASGASPQTVSTPQDLLRLGEAATNQPVIMNIVAQPKAVIPVAGTVYNYDSVLGQAGIVGLKTGNNTVDRGAFLFAANYDSQTILGVTMGAPSLPQALRDSVILLRSVQRNLQTIPVVHAGQLVGRYTAPWGSTASAVASKNLTVLGWKGTSLAAQAYLRPVSAPATSGQTVGTVGATYGMSTVPTVLQSSFNQPSLFWRILHVVG